MLPAPRWFLRRTAAAGAASATPVLDGALAGPAWGWSWLYGLLAYVAGQRRIATATDSNLDLIGGDYFGVGLLRRLGETDAGYRQRILATLLAPRGTRAAVIAVLTQLTGHAPTVFEPAHPADTGCWGDIAAGVTVTGLGYDVRRRLGRSAAAGAVLRHRRSGRAAAASRTRPAGAAASAAGASARSNTRASPRSPTR